MTNDEWLMIPKWTNTRVLIYLKQLELQYSIFFSIPNMILVHIFNIYSILIEIRFWFLINIIFLVCFLVLFHFFMFTVFALLATAAMHSLIPNPDPSPTPNNPPLPQHTHTHFTYVICRAHWRRRVVLPTTYSLRSRSARCVALPMKASRRSRICVIICICHLLHQRCNRRHGTTHPTQLYRWTYQPPRLSTMHISIRKTRTTHHSCQKRAHRLPFVPPRCLRDHQSANRAVLIYHHQKSTQIHCAYCVIKTIQSCGHAWKSTRIQLTHRQSSLAAVTATKILLVKAPAI